VGEKLVHLMEARKKRERDRRGLKDIFLKDKHPRTYFFQ
jgi:hypothetical protein